MRITGGRLRGRGVRRVPDPRTRYTPSIVRKAIFDVVDVEDKTFLDLFCGSCVVAIEALSRGASSVAVVDVSSKAVATCIHL